MAVFFLILKGILLNYKPRAVLGFKIYLADIFTDNTDCRKLNAAQRPDRGHKACPACSGVVQKVLNKSINEYADTDNAQQNAKSNDQVNGADAQRGYALKGKRDHLPQRVFAFACKSLATLVINGVRLKADKGNHSAQKEVDLLEFG